MTKCSSFGCGYLPCEYITSIYGGFTLGSGSKELGLKMDPIFGLKIDIKIEGWFQNIGGVYFLNGTTKN